jgi:hypothetical protein
LPRFTTEQELPPTRQGNQGRGLPGQSIIDLSNIIMKLTRAFIFSLCTATVATAQTNALNSSGNVGIGTTSPVSDVNAYNSIPLTLGGGLVDTSPGSTGISCSITQVFQQNSWNSPVGTIRVRGNLYHTWNTEMAFGVRNGENSLTEPLILKASGNVGIGTPNPQYKFYVKGGADGVVSYFGGSEASGIQGLYVIVGQNVTGGSESTLVTLTSSGVHAGPLSLGTGNSEALRIRTDGNVGIGTTNPTHKLAVNGTIKAKEVIVETTGWSDYVLAKNYKLLPLADVETHINANGHLPGIPSAAQVAEQGVSVGDMQARLLAKIEELTLHIIAQEKKIAAMQSQLQELQTR